MIWKIFYSSYDVAALIITVVGLALHAIFDKRGSRGD